MAKRKNRSSLQNSPIVESFITSVSKTGSDNSILTAVLFILSGLFATYIGYTDSNNLILLGGPVALILGVIILFKIISQNRKRRR